MSDLVSSYLKSKNRPVVEVDKKKFRELWLAAGKDKRQIDFHLDVSKALGSTIVIGDTSYRVTDL